MDVNTPEIRRWARTVRGTVYLIHFAEPIGNRDNPRAMAQHYTGFAHGGTMELDRRIGEHGTPAGAKIMRAVTERGIAWAVVRTWRRVPLTKELEFKRRIKNARRLCPICSGKVQLPDEPPF